MSFAYFVALVAAVHICPTWLTLQNRGWQRRHYGLRQVHRRYLAHVGQTSETFRHVPLAR